MTAMPTWPFLFPVQVRWGDMDALGHVNNAMYFRYLESARIAWYDAVGMATLQAKPTDGPGLVATNLSFRRQLKYPGGVVVEVRPGRIGERSFGLEFRVVDALDGTLCAEGGSTNVWVDYTAEKALPLPARLRVVLEAGLDSGGAAD